MKKKIAIILAVIFSLGAFALTACSDNENNKPRELNDVEKSIVGKWESPNSNGVAITFNSDGSCEVRDSFGKSSSRQFSYSGGGGVFGTEDKDYGQYEKIIIDDGDGGYNGDLWALFDNEPNRLYRVADLPMTYVERVSGNGGNNQGLNEIEQQLTFVR